MSVDGYSTIAIAILLNSQHTVLRWLGGGGGELLKGHPEGIDSGK